MNHLKKPVKDQGKINELIYSKPSAKTLEHITEETRRDTIELLKKGKELMAKKDSVLKLINSDEKIRKIMKTTLNELVDLLENDDLFKKIATMF
jgi:hypothetical protein